MSDDNILAGVLGALQGFQQSQGRYYDALAKRNDRTQAMRDELSLYQAKQPLEVATKQAEAQTTLNNQKSLAQYTSGLQKQSDYVSGQDILAAEPNLKIDPNKQYNKATIPLFKDKGDVTLGTKEQQQQDKLEEQARSRIATVRGDISLKNIETQRDAAIVAYNRISEVEKSGKTLNPIDYIDILGQIYKARTGSAPTEAVLNEANQATAKGKYGKAYTFFTGNQAPATTKDIMASLKDMASHMGQQADKLHDGYMKVHLDMPTRLESSRAEHLKTLSRGQSFSEATGLVPSPDGMPITTKTTKKSLDEIFK